MLCLIELTRQVPSFHFIQLQWSANLTVFVLMFNVLPHWAQETVPLCLVPVKRVCKQYSKRAQTKVMRNDIGNEGKEEVIATTYPNTPSLFFFLVMI